MLKKIKIFPKKIKNYTKNYFFVVFLVQKDYQFNIFFIEFNVGYDYLVRGRLKQDIH